MRFASSAPTRWLLGALVAGLAAFAALPGRAADAARDEPPALFNSDTRFTGEPFFLLTDATFGSAEPARVRLEVTNPSSLDQPGGVDVVLYRVPEPLAFLQKQRNLHRVRVEGRPADESLANTLTHLWDSWVVKSRLAWQKLFSADARRSVTAKAPELKTPKALTQPSTFEEPPQFRPIAGLELVDRFRYPVQAAKAIQPPKDVKLAGSSSDFIKPSEGNVFVPLGRRAPGLYVVEAIAGKHRATTLLFVADTVALAKVSGEQMLVFTANRQSGAAVPATRVVWTDGIGVLKTGTADAQGLARLDRKAPEQTYLFGQDPAGGVFISENFYYDSEIYAAKVYAVTDRPLYRPGDAVRVKVTGREFRSARESVPLKDAELTLQVFDPAGQHVLTQTLRFSGTGGGADTRFVLPDNATAGGYELRVTMDGDDHTAAFRVAEYQKPHFEIGLVPDKADWKTGEAIAGKLQLTYPDGKPVGNARVALTARAQTLTMIEGELDYAGQAPLKLVQDDLLTDSGGVARFSLPAASEPSRYVLTALATDGAAYRVRTSKELLVERSGGSYRLTPDRQFSRPGETVAFAVRPSERSSAGTTTATATATAPAPATKPAAWEWLRLENRASAKGAMPSGSATTLPIAFPQPGSYTVTLRDEKNRIVAATSHFVSGDGLKAPAGSIGMVFDKARYRPGETAEVLVSFPEPIDHALVTLERDKVEAAALLGARVPWLRAERIAPTQWKLQLPVTPEMSPNMTLSIGYVKAGDFVFQNQGVLVEQPKIGIDFTPDKAVYAPGETVTVEVQTTLGGKPAPAEVTVGVVDEMVYALQPEIAPSIDDFFFHPRRDNVRTSASLAFIGYDLATSKLGTLPSRRQVNERAVKLLERPRRDDVDTAAWLPRLATDAAGKARFSFVMPDSLTRWRITGRAIDAGGAVGQQVAWLRSDKPFFAKWTSPDWQREGDSAEAAIAVFNQTGQAATLAFEATGDGRSTRQTLTAQPGVNFVVLPLVAPTTAATATAAPAAASSPSAAGARLRVTLSRDGKPVDALETTLRRQPVAWRAPRELAIDLAAGPPALALPADATRVRVAFAQDAAAGAFNRWMEDLIDFPYGCVEQTASRMLPLSMALRSLSPAQAPLAPMLTQRLAGSRLALAQMAGPNARFGWWGRGMPPDAFMTGYAYYADWRATQALRTTLPAEHWQRLLEVYAKEGVALPPLQRALVLSWMQEMGLPARPMLAALVDELVAKAPPVDAAPLAARRGSLVLVEDPAIDTRDLALVLASHARRQAEGDGGADAATWLRAADAAAQRLAPVDASFVRALLLATKRLDPSQAAAVLAKARADMPTFDRAQTLVWLEQALSRKGDARGSAPASLPAPWRQTRNAAGDAVWEWPAGSAPPKTLERGDGPVGEVLGAVGYDYEQWAQVGGYAQGIGVRTRDDPAFTMLDDGTLAPRWSVSVGTQRSTYDADDTRYVVLTLPTDRSPDVVVLDADTGRRQWCVRLGSEPLSRESEVATALLDDGLVVLADDRLTRLGADGPTWEREVRLTGTDHLGPFADGLLVGGTALPDLLDPAALERREAGPALALVDPSEGRIRWTTRTPAGTGVSVVGTSEDRAVLTRWRSGDTEGTLVALDPQGREAWSVVPARGTAYDATVLAGRVLVRAGERWSAYDVQDGRRLWTFTVPTSPQFLPYGAALAAVPLLDQDHALVAGTDALHVLDLRTGRRASTPLPTDGVSTTFWPYAVALSPSLVAVATNTATVVARRADATAPG